MSRRYGASSSFKPKLKKSNASQSKHPTSSTAEPAQTEVAEVDPTPPNVQVDIIPVVDDPMPGLTSEAFPPEISAPKAPVDNRSDFERNNDLIASGSTASQSQSLAYSGPQIFDPASAEEAILSSAVNASSIPASSQFFPRDPSSSFPSFKSSSQRSPSSGFTAPSSIPQPSQPPIKKAAIPSHLLPKAHVIKPLATAPTFITNREPGTSISTPAAPPTTNHQQASDDEDLAPTPAKKPSAEKPKIKAKSVVKPKKLTAKEKGKGKAIDQNKEPENRSLRVPRKAARHAGAKLKEDRNGLSASSDDDDGDGHVPPEQRHHGEAEQDDIDAEMMPPPAAQKAKRKPAVKRTKRKKATKVNTDGEEVTDSEAEELAASQRSRKKKPIGRAKASKIDLMMQAGDDEGVDGEEGEEEGEDEDGNEKQRKRPKIAPLLVVDPGKTTMFELANSRDILQGRVSARFESDQIMTKNKKDARKLARDRMKARKARREAGEPSDDEEDLAEAAAAAESRAGSEAPSMRAPSATPSANGMKRNPSTASTPRAGSPARLARFDVVMFDEEDKDAGPKEPRLDEDGYEMDSDEEEDDGHDIVESQYAPQMRIVDGQMVIDDASLEIDRSKDARVGHVGHREVVEESAKDRFVNSATWGKQKRTEKWTDHETDMFYDLLHQYGTDFEIIARMFPSRTRNQIKAKWQKEDKINPQKITNALYHRKDIDLVKYTEVTGVNLEGPVPEDPYAKVQKMREEAEKDAKAGAKSLFGKSGGESDGDEDDYGNKKKRKSKGKGRGKEKEQPEDEMSDEKRKEIEDELKKQKDQDEQDERDQLDEELRLSLAKERAKALGK